MNRFRLAALICCALLTAPTAAAASEENFLSTLDGQYEGRGQVRLRTNREPINVTCSFTSNTSATALSLKGRCRGLLVVSRAVGAELKVTGGSYRGSYLGSRTGPAALSGQRKGNTLNLAIRWAKKVNGDRQANLSVARVGARGLTLTTRDRDPSTGKMVVTSEIVLQRK